MPFDRAPARSATLLKGAALMCLGAGVLFPLLNTCAKLLSPNYAILEIVWARFAGHFLFFLILFLPRHGVGLLRAQRPGLQVLRSFLLFGATALFMSAIGRVSLATASAINFSVPLIVTALAYPLLGEIVGWRRAAAVLVGFAGVLVVLRPGAGTIDPALLLLCGQATCYALYQIATRRAAAHDSPETGIVYAALVGTVIASLAVPFVFELPRTLFDTALFLGLGLFGGLGHYCLMRAFQLAPAALISPLGYAELLGATLLGWVVFANAPDAATWIGAAIIIASGLYVAARPPPRIVKRVP
jgi:drug/metabolite transporter (DMT)-like permease